MTAPTSGPVDAPNSLIVRRKFLGMNLVDASDLRGVVDALERRAWRSEPGMLPVVVTPNVDIVVQLNSIENPRIRRQFSDGWCVLPDGQPLIALSRKCGVPLAARLAGSSLVDELWPRLAKLESPVLVLAANDGTAGALQRENSQATIIVPPMFDGGDEAQVEKIAKSAIAAMGPETADFVFVGIGFPKSSLLMCSLLEQWPEPDRLPVLLGVGASFEMYLGERRRAPVWVQDIGLEWLFRFAQEPRRLFHRYFVRDSQFLWIALRALRESRSAGHKG